MTIVCTKKQTSSSSLFRGSKSVVVVAAELQLLFGRRYAPLHENNFYVQLVDERNELSNELSSHSSSSIRSTHDLIIKYQNGTPSSAA
jgi:hypothetical protein